MLLALSDQDLYATLGVVSPLHRKKLAMGIADLRAAYTEAQGNMDGILARMMHATIDDAPRFRTQCRRPLVRSSETKTRRRERQSHRRRPNLLG